jgi:diguanylate cyclase (GGDEF)-like protein
MLLASIWSYILQSLENQERLVIEASKVVQHNLSVTVSENLSQLLDRGKLFSVIGSQLLEQKQDIIAQTRMTAMLGTDQAFSRMVVFDLNGHVVFASPSSPNDASFIPAVKLLLASDELNLKPEMVFGRKPQTLVDAFHIPLLYPLMNNAGAKSGVLLLVLDLGYLLSLNHNLDMGITEVINIQADNGQEVVRATSAGLEFGSETLIFPNVETSKLSEYFLESKPLFQDQIPRNITYRHANKHPFATIVSQESKAVLMNFQDKKRDVLLLASLLTLVMFISMSLIAFAITRRHRAFIKLTSSENEKQVLILKLHVEKQRAIDLAATDHLTGLYNRRMFIELANNHLVQAKRNRLYYALFFIDLDRFKSINDSLGHHIGDLLLKTVAVRLQSALRESDLIARFGGDEFVLMLTGLEKEEDITGVAKKIVEVVSQPCLDLGGHDFQIYPSIGISIFPRDGDEVNGLLRNADLAMYQSKQSKNRSFTFFDASLNTEHTVEFELAQRFPQAIKNGEFVLHFQPKVEISTYRITGLEALIRWQHPDYGLIYPGSFIQLAESTGYIIELGNWLVEETCRQIALWKSEGVPIVPVAINVSAHQLKSDMLAKHIVDCLVRYGLESKCLQIEVTESSLVENFETTRTILDHLAESGMHIALDDFGTGFSSLSYIKNMPIHTIKIDRSFISNIRNNYDDTVIVTSTITLAHNLGMKVIAEGVETSEQLVYLKASGCDEVQGYFFSRPIPEDAIRPLLIQEILTP